MKASLWFVILFIAPMLGVVRAQAPTLPVKPAIESASLERGPQSVRVNFAIRPWGDVFVDGKPYGISPPLRSLPLTAGKHSITIKNSTYDSHVESIDLKPGEQATIRHIFADEKPSAAAASKGH